MALIPEVSLTEFRKIVFKPTKELAGLKSFNVTSDGRVIFTVIIPPKDGGMTITDNVKIQSEYLALSCNTVGGSDPLELIMKKVEA